MLIYFKNFFTFFSFFICISLNGMEIIPDKLAQKIMPFIITADQGIQSLTKSVIGFRSTNKKLYEIISQKYVKKIWDEHKWTLMEKMCFKYDYPRFDFAAYFYDYDIDMQTYITKNMALMNCILIEKFHSDFVEDINMIDPNFSFWKSGTTSFLEQILSWENSYNINSFVEEFLKRGAYPDIFISSYDTAHLSDNLGAHFSSFDKI